MLPFTREKLTIFGQNIFFYDRNSLVLSINEFSQQIFYDLKVYLGIQEEINKRIKMSEAINSEFDYQNYEAVVVQKLYDRNKIQRIELLYDSYVDYVLQFMQILYYEQFQSQYLYKYDQNFYAVIQDSVDSIVDDPNYDVQQLQEKINDELKDIDEDNVLNVEEKFLKTFKRFVNKSGLQLSKCYEQAIQKLQPLKSIIEQQINLEFPLKTYQDKVVEQQNLVVAKKKTKK